MAPRNFCYFGSTLYLALLLTGTFSLYGPLSTTAAGEMSSQQEMILEQAKYAARTKDYATVLELLWPLAEQGNATAQFQLAGLYRSGQGVPVDDKIAASLFTKAAEQGIAGAQYNLGVIYENGYGVTANLQQAREWYQKAAAQGNRLAKRKLEKPLTLPVSQVKPKITAPEPAIIIPPAEALRWAASRGYVQEIQTLLPQTANLDARDNLGRTALMEAAAYGYADVVKLLLTHGADPTIRDNNKNTPLMAAVTLLKPEKDIAVSPKKDNIDTKTTLVPCPVNQQLTIQYLLTGGADLEARDDHGNTPLIMAVRKGNLQLVQFLLQQGAKINAENKAHYNALFFADYYNLPKIAAVLRTFGARLPQVINESTATERLTANIIQNIQVKKQFESSLFEGWNPAMILAWQGEKETLAALLEQYDMDLEERTRLGDTALGLAAKQGHAAVIDLLLQQGAQVDALQAEDQTALHYAVQNGNYPTVEQLLAAGARVDVVAKNGHSPLTLALLGHHEAIALALIRHGARATDLPSDQKSPLHLAAMTGQHRALRALLQEGVNAEATDQNGYTPLMEAARFGHLESVLALLHFKVALDSQDLSGNTALMLAADNGHPQTVRVLIAAGAQVDLTNMQGNSALSLAANNGCDEVVTLLLANGASVDHQNRVGNSPLILAAANKHASTVQILLDNNADISLRNNRREQAITFVANNPEIAQLITQHKESRGWLSSLF